VTRYILACSFIVGLVVGGALSVSAQQRERVCLNGAWLLHRGGERDTIPADTWAQTRVPGKFAGHYRIESDLWAHFHHECANARAWYKTAFIVPAGWADGRIIRLRFEGVNHYCRVFVNGQFVGEHRSVNVPFELDINGVASTGAVNELAVYVESQPLANDGYYATSYAKHNVGIVDDVYLVSYPQVHISDVFVIPSVRKMELRAQITITNASPSDQQVRIYSGPFLESEKKLAMPGALLNVPAGSSETVEISQRWTDPILWGYGDYGTPTLYAFKTHIVTSNGATDTRFDRFGFREFWCEGNEFRLNGKYIFLTGECNGEGYTYPNNRHFLNMHYQALREMNVNQVRLGWVPRRRVRFDVADEVGMLLEVNVCNALITDPQYDPEMPPGRRPEVVKRLIQDYIRAHRNHPSIIIWESNNEAGSQAQPAPRPGNLIGLANVQAACHEVDPTRPVDPQGSPWVMVAKPLGIDFETDIYSVHPYGRPQHNDYERIARMVGFKDDRPQIIGETDTTTGEAFWGMHGRTRDEIGRAFEVYDEIGRDWANCAVEYWARGGDGFQPLTLTRYAFHGGNTATEFAAGPWGFKVDWDYKTTENVEEILPRVEWPALSGEGLKIYKLEATATHGNINWWDPERPAFTLNVVADHMRAAYAQIAGGDLPPLPERRRPEVIVTVTANGIPVPDRYVKIEPVGGHAVASQTVRTDLQGRAWFVLDEPGRYQTRFAEETDRFVPSKTIQVDWAKRDTQPGYHFIQYFDLPLPELLEIPEELTQPLNRADTDREEWLELAKAARVQEDAEAAQKRAERQQQAQEQQEEAPEKTVYDLHKAPASVVIDTRGDEWASYPAMALNRQEQLISDWMYTSDWAGPDDCSGIVKAAWDEHCIYVYAEVQDNKPRVMLPEAAAHLGDSVELYIGFAGYRDAREYDTANDFWFTLNAGAEDIEPFVFWNYNPADRQLGYDIAVAEPEDSSGYIIEARIELASIGQTMPPVGSELGFDVAINDADVAAPALGITLRDVKLDWAQDFHNWASIRPYVWRTATVLPAP